MSGIYHVYNRGANREKIFSTTENYRFLTRRIRQYLPEYGISIIAFCLMPNHYHFLLLEWIAGDKSRFFQRLFNSYTQAYNHQNWRKGTLFEGRMRVKVVDTEAYLYELIRYIHLNPVRSGLVSFPEEWSFSSHLEWIGRSASQICDRKIRSELFPSSLDYSRFLAMG